MKSDQKILAELTDELHDLTDKLDGFSGGNATATILRWNLRDEIWHCRGRVDAYAKVGAIDVQGRAILDAGLELLLRQLRGR